MGKFVDLTGQRFGRLTIIKRVYNSKDGRVQWLCRCDCGNKTIVKSISLQSGNTRSCGCLYKDSREYIKKTHGKKHFRLYQTWINMKQRCYNINNTHYNDYGARGITICDGWKNDFMLFYTWAMENGYRDDLTIDRIDVNGNYEPKNCRWVTMKEQANNKRCSHYLEYDGERLTISEWAKKLNVPAYLLRGRLKLGWSIDRTLNTEKPSNVVITIDDQVKSLSDWCKIYSKQYNLVFDRIYRLKWDPKKALETPVKNT